MATDGWVSDDGRHLTMTSNDIELLNTFKRCLGLTAVVSWKPSGYTGRLVSQVQFSDVVLNKWLVSIGITPRKTKTIGAVNVPDEFFPDYLRGEFDGDGSSHAYWDPRWHSSVSLYISFVSASRDHLIWLARKIQRLLVVEGSIGCASRAYLLRYAKSAAHILHTTMYYAPGIPHLPRKKEKLERQWAAARRAEDGQHPVGLKKRHSVLRIA
jgi:hypothetical protein